MVKLMKFDYIDTGIFLLTTTYLRKRRVRLFENMLYYYPNLLELPMTYQYIVEGLLDQIFYLVV